MADTTFNLELRRGSQPSTTVISVSGALILENLFKFQSAWREANADNIIFDLAGVPYMDSSAIGSLVNAHVSFAHRGKRIALAGVNERVKQILTVTQVAAIFRYFPDAASAEAALGDVATGVSTPKP